MIEFLFFAALAALDFIKDDDDYTPGGYGSLEYDYDGYYGDGDYGDYGG